MKRPVSGSERAAYGSRGGLSSKQLVDLLHDRCAAEYGEPEFRQERGWRYLSVSSVRKRHVGVYDFDVTLKEFVVSYESRTIWKATISVSAQLDVAFTPIEGDPPIEILDCALGGPQ